MAGQQGLAQRLAPLSHKTRLRGIRANGQNQISPRQTRPHRLTQGACGQAAAISEPLFGIDHHQRQILQDRRILKPIVQHNHTSPRRLGRPHACGTVARHPSRRKGRQQKRLIPDLCRRVPRGVHLHRPGQ